MILKNKYIELMVNKLGISKDDLTKTEMELIEYGYEIFEEKLEEISLLNKENYRISVELSNLKSSLDDTNYE